MRSIAGERRATRNAELVLTAQGVAIINCRLLSMCETIFTCRSNNRQVEFGCSSGQSLPPLGLVARCRRKQYPCPPPRR